MFDRVVSTPRGFLKQASDNIGTTGVKSSG